MELKQLQDRKNEFLRKETQNVGGVGNLFQGM